MKRFNDLLDDYPQVDRTNLVKQIEVFSSEQPAH